MVPPRADASWVFALQSAAASFDGGARSFPASSDGDIESRFPYQPPNKDYERLYQQELRPSQRKRAVAAPHCAGWLLPNDSSVCKPVLVAHSLKAAIWLIRETLSDGAVPDSVWQSLVSAAEAQAGNLERCSPTDLPPPSAQTPPPPQGAVKRSLPYAAASLPERPPKRQLRGAADTATEALLLSPTTPPQAATQERLDNELASTPQLTAPCQPTDLGGGRDNNKQHVTTVSNHNRRAERARAKRREETRAKEKVARGLAPPPPGVPRKERSAYDAIEVDDEAHVSWLLKQPVKGETDLFSSTQAPYVQAAAMLEKARSIGNASSRASAAAFLRSWRVQGTPFEQASATTPSSAPAASAASNHSGITQMQPLSSTARTSAATLVSAWSLCDRYEQELDVMHIRYRWAMAFLGKVYTEKMAQIREEDCSARLSARNRHGKGKVSSEAINAIIATISANPDRKQRLQFRRRLHYALRWYSAASELGWGMLCLMPHDVVTNTWVQNELQVRHWHIWLQLVIRVNKEACDASTELEAWLGSEGLSGGSICGKATLALEEASLAGQPHTYTQVTEVDDSEEEEEEVSSTSSCGVEEDVAEGNPTWQEEEIGNSNAGLVRHLCQPTLLELMRPQRYIG